MSETNFTNKVYGIQNVTWIISKPPFPRVAYMREKQNADVPFQFLFAVLSVPVVFLNAFSAYFCIKNIRLSHPCVCSKMNKLGGFTGD